MDFPYSFYLLKALPYSVKRGYRHRIQNHRAHEDMYGRDDTSEILSFILQTFIDRAEEVGSVPIVVFLPNWKDMVDYQETGSTIYHDFYQELKANRYVHVYDGLAYFKPRLDQGEQVRAFFNSRLEGHYNPEGERVVSAGFYRTLLSIDAQKHLLEVGG